MIVSISASGSPVSNSSNSAGSAIRPALTASARPLTKWRRGRVARVSGVDQYGFGLPERADDVFGWAKVDAGLAADRGINLGEGGGGAVDEIDAAHIAGSAEPAQVPHNAAAHRNKQVFAGHAEIEHGCKYLAVGL